MKVVGEDTYTWGRSASTTRMCVDAVTASTIEATDTPGYAMRVNVFRSAYVGDLDQCINVFSRGDLFGAST